MNSCIARRVVACVLVGVPASNCFADVDYLTQQRSIRGWISAGIVVYDETVSAPDFAPFNETLLGGYSGKGQSSNARAVQASRLDPGGISFAGEVSAFNNHQQPFSSPGSRATSQLLVTFSVSTPTAFELAGTIAGGFPSTVFREYTLALTSGAQTIVSRSSAGGLQYTNLNLTGSSVIQGTLPAGTYELAIFVQISGGVREGGMTTYDLSLHVPSAATLALPLAALPLAIRRRRHA